MTRFKIWQLKWQHNDVTFNTPDKNVKVTANDNDVINTSVEGKTLKCEITQDVEITITATEI